jgi:DnaJ-class molecular chaperone
MKQKDYKKGYYSYLELNKNSTTSEIKKSYRQLILK